MRAIQKGLMEPSALPGIGTISNLKAALGISCAKGSSLVVGEGAVAGGWAVAAGGVLMTVPAASVRASVRTSWCRIGEQRRAARAVRRS